jgi:hypothetical protein
MSSITRGLIVALLMIASTSSGCMVRARGDLRFRPVGIVIVNEEPPPPRVTVVETRPGFIWVEGRWERHGNRWDWREGRWQGERRDHRWEQGRWERRGNGHVWVEGRWVGGNNGNGGNVRDHR